MVTDINTGTTRVSLNYTFQISHKKSSFHGRIPTTNSFLHSIPYRTLSQLNWVAPIMFKITPRHGLRRQHSPSIVVEVSLWRRYIAAVATRTTGNAGLLLLRARILRALPNNYLCLQSHRLATGLYATVLK
jgi:hypothetical protein